MRPMRPFARMLLLLPFVAQHALAATLADEADYQTCINTPASCTTLLVRDQSLTGTLPTELGTLTALQNLRLDGNAFTGGIPTEMGLLIAMESFFLYGSTGLGGTIPTELGTCAALESLQLNDNGLTGGIPTELAALAAVTFLYLQGNSLTGTVPAEFAAQATITEFKVDNNADLCGNPVPDVGTIDNTYTTGTTGTNLGNDCPTASPTTVSPTPSPTVPPTVSPTDSPSTAAPTQSPTVPPTMPAMTDAQAVAAIAAVRARAAYRNNAVAPASTDPTDDAVAGGKSCPPDYHLMGGDDVGLIHGATTSPTTTISPTPQQGGTQSGGYWCQKNDEIYRVVTHQKTLDPAGVVSARAATAATLGAARDLSQGHDVAARASHATIEASGQTLLVETVADAAAALLLAKAGDVRETTWAPTVTLSNSPTTTAEGAAERSRAQNNSPALG